MSRKTVSGILTALLFLYVLLSAININVYADVDTITIKANGEVDPDTGDINATDNSNVTYTINNDLNEKCVIIEKDNIILDGQGYTMDLNQANSDAIILDGRTNVTIKNVTITGSSAYPDAYGAIDIDDCTTIFIHHNNITDNKCGINIHYSTNIFVYSNEITKCQPHGYGIDVALSQVDIAYNNISYHCYRDGEFKFGCAVLLYSNETFFYRNEFAKNSWGIIFAATQEQKTACNTVIRNNFIGNQKAMQFEGWAYGGPVNTTVFHNNFTQNGCDVYLGSYNETLSNNMDGGYACCGNYWSTYIDTDPDDDKKGRYQNETGHDHIADDPYNPSNNNNPNFTDNYPLMLPVNTFVNCSGDPNATCPLKCDINNDGIVNMKDLSETGSALGTEPGDSKWNWFADVNNDLIVNMTDYWLVYDDFWKRFPHV